VHNIERDLVSFEGDTFVVPEFLAFGAEGGAEGGAEEGDNFLGECGLGWWVVEVEGGKGDF